MHPRGQGGGVDLLADSGDVYGSLNRVTAAIERNGATTIASWAYAYDAAGNRTQQVRAGATGAVAGTTGYTYNAANRLASTTADTTTWTYDGAGNRTRNGITAQTSTINSRSAISAIGATTYTAFGAGNTEQLTRSTSTTAYTNTALGLTREQLAGGLMRNFTRTSNGDAVSTRQNSGVEYYYIRDSLGSVIGLFDQTGAFAGGYAYSPYGETRNTITAGSAVDKNSLRYIAGYFDRGSGLYKLGARYYDPTIGRFTQYDPSGQEGNPYSYAGCNPIGASDITGLSVDASTVCAGNFLIAGLLVGGAVAFSGLTLGASLAVGAAAEVALFAGEQSTC